MRGIIITRLVVDYDEMLQGDLKTIEAYTNVQGKENIAGEHLKTLANKLENVVKSPFIKFEIEGTIEPDEEEVVEPTIKDLQKDEVATNFEEEFDEVEVEVEDVDVQKDIIETLRSDLFEIGASKGIPSKITVNYETYKALEADAKLLVKANDNLKINTFLGFPLVQEAMDELYEIHYKTFEGNEEKVFTKNKIDKE